MTDKKPELIPEFHIWAEKAADAVKIFTAKFITPAEIAASKSKADSKYEPQLQIELSALTKNSKSKPRLQIEITNLTETSQKYVKRNLEDFVRSFGKDCTIINSSRSEEGQTSYKVVMTVNKGDEARKIFKSANKLLTFKTDPDEIEEKIKNATQKLIEMGGTAKV